jgi:hypothetical protein
MILEFRHPGPYVKDVIFTEAFIIGCAVEDQL